MRTFFIIPALIAGLASPAGADEVTDTLQSALDAYEDGDMQYAIEELDYAKQLMMAMKTDALVEFLPPAPEGWSRSVNREMNAGLAMMGGGVGAEAEYTKDGTSFTITLMADNPMVGAMAGMIGNAAMMGAKVERVGREKFMVKDGEVTGLVDNRIMVKGAGDTTDIILDALGTMDFRELGRFGS